MARRGRVDYALELGMQRNVQMHRVSMLIFSLRIDDALYGHFLRINAHHCRAQMLRSEARSILAATRCVEHQRHR